MSWMDSCSRPRKQDAIPPPYYLLPGGENTLYCHTCGRAISSRKTQANGSTAAAVKYCSQRCRQHKPGRLDRQIEDAFVTLLNGSTAIDTTTTTPRKKDRKIKGDSRILAPCSAVQALVFGEQKDPENVYGRKRNRARRGAAEEEEWKSVDMVDETNAGGSSEDANTAERMSDNDSAKGFLYTGTAGKVRPAQSVAEVNGSIGGEKGWAERIEETPEMLEKRKEGQRKVEEREMVRCAARRGVAFGFVVGGTDGQEEQRRKCEAVMNGKVVEPSFAKGEWGIRWRE